MGCLCPKGFVLESLTPVWFRISSAENESVILMWNCCKRKEIWAIYYIRQLKSSARHICSSQLCMENSLLGPYIHLNLKEEVDCKYGPSPGDEAD